MNKRLKVTNSPQLRNNLRVFRGFTGERKMFNPDRSQGIQNQKTREYTESACTDQSILKTNFREY